MSDAREAVLGRIRTALAGGPAVPPPMEHSFRREGERDPAILADGFAARVRDYKVRVERVAPADAAATVKRLLEERGHHRLVVPDGFPAAFLPPGLATVSPAAGRDVIAAADGVLSTCACAIAVTGTIVLDHGAGQGPRVATLLPDYHLCVVEADRLVELVPEAVARMDGAVRAGRPLTFISGGSATSDIELDRVEGVHGPRTLDVVLLDPP